VNCHKDLPKGEKLKIVVWHVLVVVLAWWMWNTGQHATFNSVTGIDLNILPLSVFILLTAVVVMGYIMFRQRRLSVTITALIGLLFMVSFGWTWLNALAVLVLFGFNLWSATRVRREINERRILNIPDAFYHGLMPVVLGLFVMISFAAYQSPLLNEIKSAQKLPNQSQVFFRQIIDKTFGQKIEASTPQQRNKLITEITSQTFQEFNSILKPYFQYAPPVLAFSLFLILWGISFIFVWLGILAGLILYWVLKKVNIIKIEKKEVQAEILVV